MMDKCEPRYSGPNRSGICKCGHSWEDHHLSCVMNLDYLKEANEAYVPEECCYFGCNEVGGLKYENGEWVDHCHGYVDSMKKEIK